jgi:glycosyltransferase involved in cell wall biosynthesis
MRVLIAGLWAAEQPSGICRTVVNLIRGLNEGCPSMEVSLAIGSWQRRYFEDTLGLNALNASILEVHIQNRSVMRNRWYAFALPDLARSVSADIVHLSFPVPVLRSRFRCPLVTTLHDLYPHDRPDNFGYPHVLGNRLFLRQALRASDRVVCVSQFTRSRLEQLFPRFADSRALCIRNAIYLGATPEPKAAENAAPYLLAVAQHRANKNLDLLLHAFYEYVERGRASHHLVIVGSNGPETERLHALIHTLHLRDRVVFLSGQTDAQMTALYRGCEVFITLADIEGFGLPLGEALLCGARAVASDIPTHREVAGEHCEYVPAGASDIPSILQAIDRAVLRQRPSPGVVADLSPASVAACYSAVYHALANKAMADEKTFQKLPVAPASEIQ